MNIRMDQKFIAAPASSQVRHYRAERSLGKGNFLGSGAPGFVLAWAARMGEVILSMQTVQQYTRYCPGEEHIRLSDAICFGRRRVNFPKCPGCQFNDDEQAARRQQRVLAHGLIVQEGTPLMLDEIFKAYDIRGVYPDALDEQAAWRIGFACGTFLKSTLRGTERSDVDMARIVVGRDMRRSSPTLAAALIEGARCSGVGVVDIGMIDTPQLYFAVNHFKCCGGVQTTASHNPAQYNGFKISGRGGKPIGSETGLNDIRVIARNTAPHETHLRGDLTQEDLSEAYRAFVLSFFKPSRRLKIVVDASNGMAGRWVPIVFRGVAHLEIDGLNFEHAGQFVHDPNPLVTANLEQLRQRVCEISADAGVCFDGDADRCVLIDEQGRNIPCDLLTAMLAGSFLKQRPKSTIVYDLRSSRIVPETIVQAGGTPQRCRVGHVFMKKALAENQALFGGELSGHFYFRDNWFCDSGLLAFVHSLNILGQAERPLSELLAPYRKYHGSGERNFINEDPDGTIRKLTERYADGQVDFLDGATVQFAQWWFNVRKSNTEPLLRLNLEADTPKLLKQKLAEVGRLLGKSVKH